MKSGLHTKYKTNAAAEKAGVPLRFPANADGSVPTFNVARMGGGNNKHFQAVYAAAMAPHQAEKALGILSEETLTRVSISVFVDACLRGWSNVQTEEGVSLAYTRENAIALFLELPDLFETLNESAALFATFRAVNVEASAKN